MTKTDILVIIVLFVALIVAVAMIAIRKGKKHIYLDDNSQQDLNDEQESGIWANAGAECKSVAKLVLWLGVIGSVIYGILLMVRGLIISGLAIIVLGSFGSYLSSIGLYAIGEAAENSAYVARYIMRIDAETDEDDEE